MDQKPDQTDVVGTCWREEIKTWHCTIGGRPVAINEHVVVEGTAPDGFARFRVRQEFVVAHGPQGPIGTAEIVTIPGATIQEAFANLKPTCEARFKVLQGEFMRDQAKSQIVTAGVMPNRHERRKAAVQ